MIRKSGRPLLISIFLIGKYLNNSRTTEESMLNAVETLEIVEEGKKLKDQNKENNKNKKEEIVDINRVALEAVQGAGTIVLNMNQEQENER